MKKPTILLILLLLLCINAFSQKWAYAVFKDSTLTFYYNDKKPEGAYDVEKMVKDSDYDEHSKEWWPVRSQIKKVIFDKSFKKYRPKSCRNWFYKCDSLTSVKGIKKNLNTSEVADMSYMFAICANLRSLDVSGFNTDKVTNMCSMFSGCKKLTNLDVSGFKTDNVTNMSYMFSWCKNLTSIDVSGFKTDNVTDMRYMFALCEKLTSLDVSRFNTDKVTDMSGMFIECKELTSLDVSGFNTDKVTDMSGMFIDCKELTSLDVSGFNTDNVIQMSSMFAECINLKTIYIGNGWNAGSAIVSKEMFYNCSNLVGGQGTKYDSSFIDKTRAHNDCGESNPGYLTRKPGLQKKVITEAYAVLKDSTLTFYYNKDKPDGAYDVENLVKYQDYSYVLCFKEWAHARQQIKTVILDSSFKEYRPESCSYWFDGCKNLTSIKGIKENLNTSEVTDMSGMFEGCKSLTTLDLSDFHTDNVTRMSSMFAECINLKSIYIGDGWNTSKVPEGTDMFKGCPNLTGGQGTKYDPSFIDKTRAHNDDGESNPGYLSRKTERQSKVKPEAYAVLKDSTLTFFYGKNIPEGAFDVEHLNKEQLYYNELYFKEWTYACSRIKTVVFDSSFKEYKPKSCSYWFDGCINLTSIKGIKENLNTSEVTDMAFMFRRCGTLTSLDLSGCNTENVTDMRGMFKGCIDLKTIDVGDGWNTSDVTESYEMFGYCRNLMGGKGTKYDPYHTAASYAHTDGGESNPGYFTKKTK